MSNRTPMTVTQTHADETRSRQEHGVCVLGFDILFFFSSCGWFPFIAHTFTDTLLNRHPPTTKQPPAHKHTHFSHILSAFPPHSFFSTQTYPLIFPFPTAVLNASLSLLSSTEMGAMRLTKSIMISSLLHCLFLKADTEFSFRNFYTFL